MNTDNKNLLTVSNLEVSFRVYGGTIHAVRDVDFGIERGECVAVVGESGCGKSVTAKSIMALNPKDSEVSGSILLDGVEIMNLSDKELQDIRGNKVSMIFQDPMTSLNPTMTIGKQIAEVLIKHQNMNKKQAIDTAIEYLRMVGIANPEKRVKEYPDSLSGGMRQRVMIAMAMCCNPELLIADEPTTALDVTVQAQILDLMKELKEKFNTAIMLITHDLGVVANMADRVIVFYAGKIVETGTVENVLKNPSHPYTACLLKSMPGLNTGSDTELVSIEGAPPDLFAPPQGCSFAARCEHAMKICRDRQAPYVEVEDGHCSNCWMNLKEVRNNG